MIDLAFHCLLFVESVRYELKKEYYEILSQIFMRDELRLSNLALGAFLEDLDSKISDLYLQKEEEKKHFKKSQNLSQQPAVLSPLD